MAATFAPLFRLCRAAAEGADGGDPGAGLWRAGRAGRGGAGLRSATAVLLAISAFRCRNTHRLFSFFLCRLKLRHAFLQNDNSAFEVIYCATRRVKFLLVVRRIFRNQFLQKVYVALQATCSSHHAFFHRADFHTRHILCACGTGTERHADGKNQRFQHDNPARAMRHGDATRGGGT